jgi:hypothetical protein
LFFLVFLTISSTFKLLLQCLWNFSCINFLTGPETSDYIVLRYQTGIIAFCFFFNPSTSKLLAIVKQGACMNMVICIEYSLTFTSSFISVSNVHYGLVLCTIWFLFAVTCQLGMQLSLMRCCYLQ